jgi:hypothetical protein
MSTANIINVRWWDGYLETFEASEVPLLGVRWWSQSIESHAAPGVSE